MARDTFRDAAGLVNAGAPYEWEIGHESEDPEENTINLERTAVTSGVGFVRQQGAPSPTVRKYHGWASLTQIEIMREFFNACAGRGTVSRTIFYTDIDGSEHEVMITSFAPQRSVGRFVGRGGERNYIIQYSITIELIT